MHLDARGLFRETYLTHTLAASLDIQVKVNVKAEIASLHVVAAPRSGKVETPKLMKISCCCGSGAGRSAGYGAGRCNFWYFGVFF